MDGGFDGKENLHPNKKPVQQRLSGTGNQTPLTPQSDRIVGSPSAPVSSGNKKYPLAIPLLKSYNDIFEMIKQKPHKNFVGPPPTSLQEKEGASFCKYHGIRNHLTDSCYQLKNFIQKLVREGKLPKLIDNRQQLERSVSRPPQRGRTPLPPPPQLQMRTIHMIMKGPLSFTRTERRLEQRQIFNIHKQDKFKAEPHLAPEIPYNSNSLVWFDDSDVMNVHTPHLDALVVTLQIASCKVEKIMVDTGSSIDLMMYFVFLDLGYSKTGLVPSRYELFAFNGAPTEALGDAVIPVVAGPIVKYVTFSRTDFDSTYNVILGRPWIHSMRAVPSTYHQLLRFPTPFGIYQVRGNQATSQHCMEIQVKSNTRNSVNRELIFRLPKRTFEGKQKSMDKDYVSIVN